MRICRGWVVWPTYCFWHWLHWSRYITLLLWQVKKPFVGFTTGKHLLDTLLFTKLLVCSNPVHVLHCFLKQGFIIFLGLNSVNGNCFCCLNVGGCFPVYMTGVDVDGL